MPTITVTAPTEVGSGAFALAANTEHVIDFNRDITEVEVGAVGATDIIWVSVNGVAATVGGKHCYPIPFVSGSVSAVNLDVPSSGNTRVRIITAGTTTTTWVVRAGRWNAADE